MRVTAQAWKHTLIAVGAGAAAFCADAATITDNEWLKAAFIAAGVALGAMGVGVAKRSDP